MDCSTNQIDLEFLINQRFRKNSLQKKTIDHAELEFYRRRILYLTKEMLFDTKRPNFKINDAFENYITVCIEYFKFTDKNDIIQQKYTNLKKQIPTQPSTLKPLVLKKRTKPVNIAELLQIQPKPKPVSFPKKLKINLRQNHLKNKGIPLLDKNIYNKYENTKKKKKNIVKMEI